MPVFAARTSKSSTTARSCLRISPVGRGKMESTERVFCAVTHVITDVPCTPIEANDFRSAWIPAPPPESLPAIVSAVRTGRAMGPAGLRLTRGRRSENHDPDSVKYHVPHANRAMRSRSGHIEFDKKVRWKNLIPAFRPLFLKFLEETQQMPEDVDNVDVLIEENLRDLRNNRKPEGYNREGAMRMIFPISNKVEFYVYGRGKTIEVAHVTEQLSRVLQKYRLKHTIAWDRLKLLADKKEA